MPTLVKVSQLVYVAVGRTALHCPLPSHSPYAMPHYYMEVFLHVTCSSLPMQCATATFMPVAAGMMSPLGRECAAVNRTLLA